MTFAATLSRSVCELRIWLRDDGLWIHCSQGVCELSRWLGDGRLWKKIQRVCEHRIWLMDGVLVNFISGFGMVVCG